MTKQELVDEIEKRRLFEESQVKAKGDYCDGQAFAYLMALSYIKTLEEPKIMYLCDKEKNVNCGKQSCNEFCNHTLDIKLAKNFEKLEDSDIYREIDK